MDKKNGEAKPDVTNEGESEVHPPEIDEVPFQVIDEVPIFPGCENITSKKECFQGMIQKHIKSTFRYPQIARDLRIEGSVRASFIIQEDGNIGNITAMGPDENLEKEAIRIINLLPKMAEPGKHEGRTALVSFSIPIMFELEEPIVGGCVITITNSLVDLKERAAVMGAGIIRVPQGEYEVLDYREVYWVSSNRGFFKIRVGNRTGWVENNTWTIAGKTDDCR